MSPDFNEYECKDNATEASEVRNLATSIHQKRKPSQQADQVLRLYRNWREQQHYFHVGEQHTESHQDAVKCARKSNHGTISAHSSAGKPQVYKEVKYTGTNSGNQNKRRKTFRSPERLKKWGYECEPQHVEKEVH